MRILLCGVFLVASAMAQVAPASLAAVDGNASSSWPFDRGQGRYQQIHRTVPGPVTITGIGFRRDAGTPPTAVPRWWSEFVVRMGEGEFERAVPSFAANQRTPAVEVVHRRRIVLPDWSVPSTSDPRPFDFVIPFDVPYVHTGQAPLLWEIEVFDQSGVGALGAVDAFTTPMVTVANGVAIGVGCGRTLSGFIGAFAENRHYVWLGEWPYVWTSPRFYAFGFSDPNLTLPELCVPLRVDPVAILVSGPGANMGYYAPYDPAMVGVGMRAQLFVPNGAQLEATNAVALTFPSLPSHGDQDVVQVTQDGSSSWVGLERGSGVVVFLQ